MTVQDREDFVQRQVVDKWPGNTNFSDWRERKYPEPITEQGDSVMMLPYFDCLVGNHKYSGKGCERCEDALLDAPTTSDLEMLARMYPMR